MPQTVDISTLAMVAVASTMLLPPLIIAVGLAAGPQPGTRDWIQGSILFAIGFVLLAQRGLLHDSITIVLANTLIVAGHGTFAVGCRRFFAMTVRRRWDYWLSGAIALTMVVFWLGDDNRAARVVLVSLAISGCLAVCTHAVWREARVQSGSASIILRVVASLVSVTVFTMLLRAGLNLGPALGLPRGPNADVIEAFHFLIATIADVGFAASLPLLVSQRMAAELAASRQRLDRIHEIGLLGFAEVNPKTGAAWASPVYERLVGMTDGVPRTLDGWLSMFHPDDRHIGEARVQQFRSATAPLRPIEYRIRRPSDGATRWIWSTSERTVDAHGDVARISTIVIDITDRKEAELAVRQAHDAAASANRAKSEFLANMSHEFRTPLHGVLGNAQLLADGRLDAEQALCVSGIEESARGLLQLVNDVLDHSSLDTGQLHLARESIDLPTLLHSLQAEYAAPATAKGLHFEVAPAPALPAPLLGDARRLHQVLANLVSNAVKFTPRGGVTVSAALIDGDGMATPARVRFAVTDTGIGIAPDLLARLFTPFFQAESSITRRHGGTGLGLSLAKRLTERMGGTIDVVTSPLSGSQFRVDLPLHPQDTPAPVGRDASFDPASLLATTMNDGDLARTIAQAAAGDLTSLLARLDDARAAVRWHDLSDALHEMRGLVLQLGDTSLAARLKAIEADYASLASSGPGASPHDALPIPRDTITALAHAASRWAATAP